jgi:hypothetical protein
LAVPMIAVGIVTSGVAYCSLNSATGAGKPPGGVRYVNVWVASPSFPSASNALTVAVNTPGVAEVNVAVPAELKATVLPLISKARLASGWPSCVWVTTESVTVSPTRAVVSETLSVTSGGSRFEGSVLSSRVNVSASELVLPATSVTCAVKV